MGNQARAKCYTYQQAMELMQQGKTMSVNGGQYDYYCLNDGHLVGMYSCSDDTYNTAVQHGPDDRLWYFISDTNFAKGGN